MIKSFFKHLFVTTVFSVVVLAFTAVVVSFMFLVSDVTGSLLLALLVPVATLIVLYAAVMTWVDR